MKRVILIVVGIILIAVAVALPLRPTHTTFRVTTNGTAYRVEREGVPIAGPFAGLDQARREMLVQEWEAEFAEWAKQQMEKERQNWHPLEHQPPPCPSPIKSPVQGNISIQP